MSKKNVNVGPSGDGHWTVKRDGAKRATRVTDTQREAIEIAKPMAERNQVDLVVRGRDGRIRSKDSYGPDPNPPKDQEH